MAHISKQMPVPASQAPVAQQAADLLWNFQLRKEHEQLLAKLNAHQEQLSTYVSDTQKNCQKLYARLDAVEKKFDKLVADDKKLGQVSNRLYNELQALREKMGSIAKNAERPGKLSSSECMPWALDCLLTFSPASNTSNNQTMTETASTSHRQMLQSSAKPMDKTNSDEIQTSLSSDPIPRTSSTDTDKTLPTESSSALDPRTRVPAKRKEVSSDPVNAELNKPLRQGKSTFKEYLLMADRLVAGLPPRSSLARTESKVVEMFIKGLSNNKGERRTLRASLQHRDLWTIVPSANEGRNIILVRWLDFKEAVRRSKLLEVTHDVESSSVSKDVVQSETVTDVGNASNVAESSKKQEEGPKPKKRRTLYL